MANPISAEQARNISDNWRINMKSKIWERISDIAEMGQYIYHVEDQYHGAMTTNFSNELNNFGFTVRLISRDFGYDQWIISWGEQETTE